MHLIKSPTETLPQVAADWLVSRIRSVLEMKPRFTLALSGGSTPKTLFQRLLDEPYYSQIEWHRLHVFWGDERVVPFESGQNNAGEAFRVLLDHVPVVRDQVYPIRTDIQPEESAAEYEALLHTYFDNHPCTFDLVLLGMGDDGHTLSLFPGTEAVFEKDKWVTAFYLEKQKMHRITLTAPVVNQAACVAFLVAGQNKAAVLKQVLKGPYQPGELPSQQIKPLTGELWWFLDEAAGEWV